MTHPDNDLEMLDRVQRFVETAAKTCVHEARGLLPRRFVTPTYSIQAGADDENPVAERSLVGHYLQMYDWDACLFSQAAHRIGIDGLPLDVIENFLSLKEENGFIPRTVSPSKVWDAGDQAKPFLCQTLLKETERTPVEPSRLTELVKRLAGYLSYFHHHRREESSGLYYWRNVLESGIDNNLALLPPHEAAQSEFQLQFAYPDRILAVDLNAYLVNEFQAITRLAEMCEMEEIRREYQSRANELIERIESKLWCDHAQMYLNFDFTAGELVRIKAWTGLTPVIAGFASADRAKAAIVNNILDESQFLRPHGIASLAYSEPLYNNSRRGLFGRALVCNWQGPVWVLPNAWIARALVKQGYRDEAREVAARVIANLDKDITARQTIHESYNAETGDPVWAPQFMSWNILTLDLIELIRLNEEAKQTVV